MLSQRLENKIVGNLVENNVSHNSPIGPADCQAIVPEIVQLNTALGDTSTMRVGDRITPKSLIVKGVISLRTDQLYINQPIMVRVLILAQKDIKRGAQVNAGAVNTNSLLRPGLPGINSEIPFAGNTLDLCVPVNKDLFRVYMDKTIKLSPPGSGSVETAPGFAATYSYKFKKLPTSLTFNEGSDWANNFAPFMAIGYAYMDGTSPDILNTRVVHNCFSQLQFEDA